MATLERERGPYIMDQILSNAVVVPNGYELNGPFIF